MKEKQLIAAALGALANETGLTGHVLPGDDTVVEFDLPAGAVQLRVDARQHVRRSMIGRLRKRLHGEHGLPGVLACPYVDPRLAQALHDASVQFMDTAGNAYLALEGVYVFIKGEPKPDVVAARDCRGRAFQPVGLRLTFAFLLDPESVNLTYRELAAVGGLSLATVKYVMDDLTVKGYLQTDGRRRHLTRMKQLLDEWSIGYRDRLRPGVVEGRYRAEKVDWWEGVALARRAACWGGEVAAAKLGILRRPQTFTFYRWGNINQVIAKGRLTADAAGDIEVLEAFWPEPKGELCPLILVYADLVSSGVERNIKAAEELYDREITNRFA